MAYHEMTDDDVKRAVRHICATSRTEEQIRHRIRTELHYPHDAIAITSTETGMGPHFMVMIWGPSGKVLSS